MSIETPKRVAIVTDTCCSVRPEDKLAQELEVVLVPVGVDFYKDKKHFPYSDLDLSPAEFYRMMKASDGVTTSGVITGKACLVYQELSEKTNSICSIHLSSKLSGAFEAADLGAQMVRDCFPELSIEVIDSHQVSLGQWLLVQFAARLAQKGVALEQIKKEVLEMIPQIQLLAAFNDFENLKKSGRLDIKAKALLGSFFKRSLVLGVGEGGTIKTLDNLPDFKVAQERMLERVGDSGKLAEMAVIHTNACNLALDLKKRLGKIYKGEISVSEAGPAIAVHTGPGAVGVAFQKA